LSSAKLLFYRTQRLFVFKSADVDNDYMNSPPGSILRSTAMLSYPTSILLSKDNLWYSKNSKIFHINLKLQDLIYGSRRNLIVIRKKIPRE